MPGTARHRPLKLLRAKTPEQNPALPTRSTGQCRIGKARQSCDEPGRPQTDEVMQTSKGIPRIHRRSILNLLGAALVVSFATGAAGPGFGQVIGHFETGAFSMPAVNRQGGFRGPSTRDLAEQMGGGAAPGNCFFDNMCPVRIPEPSVAALWLLAGAWILASRFCRIQAPRAASINARTRA